MVRLSFAIAGMLLFPATTAVAQDAKAPERLIDALAACLEIPNDSQRLACSDKAARALVDATKRKEVVVMDRADVTKTRRSLFGFTLPKLKLFGGGDDDREEEIEQLEAKIERVAAQPQNGYVITIEGGARWRTTEPWTRSALPQPGVTVTIKRAALGSYFIKIGSGRAVRAIRIG